MKNQFFRSFFFKFWFNVELLQMEVGMAISMSFTTTLES